MEPTSNGLKRKKSSWIKNICSPHRQADVHRVLFLLKVIGWSIVVIYVSNLSICKALINNINIFLRNWMQKSQICVLIYLIQSHWKKSSVPNHQNYLLTNVILYFKYFLNFLLKIQMTYITIGEIRFEWLTCGKSILTFERIYKINK